jgi:hypothetical protein
MDFQTLAKVAADRSIGADVFLPVAEAALTSDDPRCRAIAPQKFILKVMRADPRSWGDLRIFFSKDEIQETPERVYLFKLAQLGLLFVDRTVSDRDAKCARLVHWLIRNDPTDSILQYPYCHDFNGPPYDAVGIEWLKVLAKRPADVPIITNVAGFFLSSYPEQAKSLFERCHILEPDNPEWAERIKEANNLC